MNNSLNNGLKNNDNNRDWSQVVKLSTDIEKCDFNEQREIFLIMITRQSCRFGVPIPDLVKYVCKHYGCSVEEMNYVVKNFYKLEEYGRDLFLLNNIFSAIKPNLETAPEIPKEVYDSLPLLLKRAIEVINDGRQRDMFLVSALTVLSGCIHNFTGIYDGKKVFPNIYSFIIAPAANGKGITEYSKRLALKYHLNLMEEINTSGESKCDNKEFKQESANKLFYLPANSSAAAFVEKLKASGGRAVMFETEADTISTALKNDWGGYSELMRLAFHHETISMNRRGRDGLSEINNPRLSISITGTPAQVGALHQSQENGLFSRFAFYGFSDIAVWNDVSPRVSRADKGEYFDSLADEVIELVKFCESYPANFNYYGQQWERFNQRFSMLLDYNGLFGNNNDFSSVITRQGLIRYRISMVLSALRRFDNQEKNGKCECDQIDFESAEIISEVLLAHSLIAMDLVPRSPKLSMGSSEQRFYECLPTSFDRIKAVEAGKNINLKSRSCDRYLSILVGKGKLEKVANGAYLKL